MEGYSRLAHVLNARQWSPPNKNAGIIGRSGAVFMANADLSVRFDFAKATAAALSFRCECREFRG
jgi:hypothetical protein